VYNKETKNREQTLGHKGRGGERLGASRVGNSQRLTFLLRFFLLFFSWALFVFAGTGGQRGVCFFSKEQQDFYVCVAEKKGSRTRNSLEETTSKRDVAFRPPDHLRMGRNVTGLPNANINKLRINGEGGRGRREEKPPMRIVRENPGSTSADSSDSFV